MDHPLRHLAVLTIAALLCGSEAEANDAPLPPPDQPGAGAGAATLARMPASRLRLGALDIVLEETTLAQVQAALAAGRIAERGDAGDHILWLCYTVEGEHARQRLWLVSSGELGGAEHVVDGVAAAVVPAGAPVPASCPLLPARLTLSLDREIWLGLTRDELIRRLGKPSEERGEALDFAYDGGIKLAPGRPESADEQELDLDVTSTLRVELSEGRAARLWASKITSD